MNDIHVAQGMAKDSVLALFIFSSTLQYDGCAAKHVLCCYFKLNFQSFPQTLALLVEQLLCDSSYMDPPRFARYLITNQEAASWCV